MGVRIVANLGPFRDPLSRFVMVSLAAHAVVVVALVVLPTLRGSDRMHEPPLFVDLVAAAPAGPPAGSTQAAPPTPPPAADPEPSEPAEGVRVETREPPPADPLPENPEPVNKPSEKKPARQAPPARSKSTGPPVENPAPGEASAGPGGPPGQPGASITATEGGDPALAWYTSQLTGALYSTWRKPLLEGVREPFEVRVVFDVLRDGSVRNLKVDLPSGIRSLDRSALRAVSDASPLPPIPRSWREPVLSVAFTFRLFPE